MFILQIWGLFRKDDYRERKTLSIEFIAYNWYIGKKLIEIEMFDKLEVELANKYKMMLLSQKLNITFLILFYLIFK